MPRPRKCRKVCCMPKTTEFSPTACHDNHKVVSMTVDEYETIRLIEGGDYQICSGEEKVCKCGGCDKHRCQF